MLHARVDESTNRFCLCVFTRGISAFHSIAATESAFMRQLQIVDSERITQLASCGLTYPTAYAIS